MTAESKTLTASHKRSGIKNKGGQCCSIWRLIPSVLSKQNEYQVLRPSHVVMYCGARVADEDIFRQSLAIEFLATEAAHELDIHTWLYAHVGTLAWALAFSMRWAKRITDGNTDIAVPVVIVRELLWWEKHRKSRWADQRKLTSFWSSNCSCGCYKLLCRVGDGKFRMAEGLCLRVPCYLTEEQKLKGKNVSWQLLERYAVEGDEFLYNKVKGDGSRFH